MFAAVMSVVAAILCAFLPDLPASTAGSTLRPPARTAPVCSVLAEHRRVLLTLGTGVMVISAARSTRQSIVPLWADSQGIDAATVA